MFVQINPIFNFNYRPGQIYCCYEIGHPISMGISYFSYKDGDTPAFEKISHVGVCIDEKWGISAQPHGIDYEDLFKIFNDPKRRIFFVSPVRLDKLGSQLLINGMRKRLGEKYDWKLIAGFGIVNSWLGRKFPESIKESILRIFDAKGRQICSEIIADVLYREGYCDDPNTRKIPKDIVECKCIKPWKRD